MTLVTSRPFLLLDWLCFALVNPRRGGALGKHASIVLVQILTFPCRFGQKLIGWPLGKLATPPPWEIMYPPLFRVLINYQSINLVLYAQSNKHLNVYISKISLLMDSVYYL